MSNITIALIDTDESYLTPIELKFIHSFGDQAKYIVITDINYLEQFFSKPQDIDIMVIDEKLYDHSYDRHNIGKIFLLTDDREDQNTEECSNRIYKYSSDVEVFNQIITNSPIDKLNLVKDKETKVIMVYSPIGGSGKTALSLGISSALSKTHKKVLYINTETIQSFFIYLQDFHFLSNDKLHNFFTKDADIISFLSEVIENEFFDYVLPVRQSISSLNIQLEQYQELIEKLKDIKLYDYIILDTSTEFNAQKTKLMGRCNKIILITGEDSYSKCKIASFLENIDYGGFNRFIFVSNVWNSQPSAKAVNMDPNKKFTVSEYIQKWEDSNNVTISMLGDNVNYNNIIKLL
ncbi:AAA domain-containing protein [Mobilisporobacter senegalensis]|uniref:AAA domain-containing protein n=1 Tax=Mobilisporobacter senegalensis TaxID=1329262 RepID=A0A3N1XYV8_9FIRM|nr:AAA family ATPase [Mobilisporobacter senegalensis]ROR31764.1 AAA domain-containing protein [Mobilisporobacter senegalensis]